jgi:uncharacterized protein DUF3551
MRSLRILPIAFAALALSGFAADAAPWCAQYGGRAGGTNCGFHSFQQCLDTVRGIGGFCSRNPFEAYGYNQQRPHARR